MGLDFRSFGFWIASRSDSGSLGGLVEDSGGAAPPLTLTPCCSMWETAKGLVRDPCGKLVAYLFLHPFGKRVSSQVALRPENVLHNFVLRRMEGHCLTMPRKIVVGYIGIVSRGSGKGTFAAAVLVLFSSTCDVTSSRTFADMR